MREDEVPGISYIPSKPSLLSAIKKLAVKLHLMSPEVVGGVEKVGQGKPLQQQTDTIMDKHTAMISMLNQGKNYDDAERIATVTDEYGIELNKLDADKIRVKGKSVWIDLEN